MNIISPIAGKIYTDADVVGGVCLFLAASVAFVMIVSVLCLLQSSKKNDE